MGGSFGLAVGGTNEPVFCRLAYFVCRFQKHCVFRHVWECVFKRAEPGSGRSIRPQTVTVTYLTKVLYIGCMQESVCCSLVCIWYFETFFKTC